MAQPVWITPAGSLGTIPEGIFYQIPLEAYEPEHNEEVYYQIIAGELPAGIQCRDNGLLVGVPRAIATIQGVPTQVAIDITSKFVVRAYTKITIGTVTVINRLADRTFTITVTGPDAPEFITPPGTVGTFYDGSLVAGLQIEYVDTDPGDVVVVKLVSGRLPPGTTISSTGLIKGFIQPNSTQDQLAGYSRDSQGFSQYPYDFGTRSSNATYEFTLEITDGRFNNLRTFNIVVYSQSSLTADNTYNTADNTFITADETNVRLPILLTPVGSIGSVKNDNFFAFQFDGIDLDGDPFGYELNGSIPGLTLDPISGWLYGYIPDLGLTELVFDFTVRVYKINDPIYISPPYLYSLTVTGPIDSQIAWLTPSDLGTIANGSTSTLYVEAVNRAGLSLQYKLKAGAVPGYSTSSITSLTVGTGLQTLSVGTNLKWTAGELVTISLNSNVMTGIVVSYNIDGAMVVDVTSAFGVGTYAFWLVNLTNPIGIEDDYVPGVYNLLPQGLQLLPDGSIAGRVSFDTFALDTGATTFDATPRNGKVNETTFDLKFTFTVTAFSNNAVVNVSKTFTITVARVFDQPYENLYIQAMPPLDDRAMVNNLLQDSDVFPPNLIYRPQDPNFGVATRIIYNHAFGLTSSTIDAYYSSLYENHYWKNLVLGNIKVAQARDSNNKVIYEVVYSQVIDNLLNDQGQSVSKQVTLPYPIIGEDSTEIAQVYPNSLINMRDQVIDTVGQVGNILPTWMLSKQANGQVLGFIPAWVIAYVKPGRGEQIAYNIRNNIGNRLNLVDFEVDRYELDRLLTHNWSALNHQWIPTPATCTTFDVGNSTGGVYSQWTNDNDELVQWENDYLNTVEWSNDSAGSPTIFDAGSMKFIDPVDMYSTTQIYDRYLLFPRRNILSPAIPVVNNIVYWKNNINYYVRWKNSFNSIVNWKNNTV
jgi:hypothetical protein